MAYLFVGVQGVDSKGDRVQISSYFTPDGEDAESINDVLAKAKSLASDLKLNIKETASVGGGVHGRSNGNTEIAEIGSFAVRTQRNLNAETKQFTFTPAVVLYPKWSPKGDYGKYSVTTAFLNFPEDIAAFEEWLARLGLNKKLSDFPVYNGQGSPQRMFGIVDDWEIQLPKLGEIEVSHTPYTKQDGSDGKRTKLVRWL